MFLLRTVLRFESSALDQCEGTEVDVQVVDRHLLNMCIDLFLTNSVLYKEQTDSDSLAASRTRFSSQMCMPENYMKHMQFLSATCSLPPFAPLTSFLSSLSNPSSFSLSFVFGVQYPSYD